MNAERLLAHYERIADAPDAIARLRRFILDLAVHGKLELSRRAASRHGPDTGVPSLVGRSSPVRPVQLV